MTHTTKALVFAAIACTGAAALALGLAGSVPQEGSEIVQLERVVIVRKSVQGPVAVAQLPRVVVTGRRAAPTEVHLAAAKLLKAI